MSIAWAWRWLVDCRSWIERATRVNGEDLGMAGYEGSASAPSRPLGVTSSARLERGALRDGRCRGWSAGGERQRGRDDRRSDQHGSHGDSPTVTERT